MGEPRDPTNGMIIHPEHGVVEEPPFTNLYILYLIQAGCVAVPIFFIWILTKRSKMEDVQMALHHREHHSKEHPEEERISLSKAVEIIRVSRSVRQTVHNDFKQFSTAVR
jgi:hypothetical protein